MEVLGYAEIDKISLMRNYPFFRKFSSRVISQLEIQSKYNNHVKKQRTSIFSYKKDKNIRIPDNIDYSRIGGLSKESRNALESVRPEDLATASQIPGVTAAALSSVLLYTKKKG